MNDRNERFIRITCRAPAGCEENDCNKRWVAEIKKYGMNLNDNNKYNNIDLLFIE
jgi:hypothetical protein